MEGRCNRKEKLTTTEGEKKGVFDGGDVWEEKGE